MSEKVKTPEAAEAPKEATANPVNSVVLKAIVDDRVTVLDSKAIKQDEFSSFYSSGVLEPLYSPEQLIRLPELSDILAQCIDSYKINIAGFGPQMAYDRDYDKLPEGEKKQLEQEWTRYDNFFKYSNFDESFTDTMMKVIDDRERIGWGTMEVLEDSSGAPAGVEHIPAYKVRLCPKERKPIPVSTTIMGDDGKPLTITYMKRFRKFVQIVNGERVYFKEFGDPRTLNCRTGEYGDGASDNDLATSIIFLNIYCPYSVYGLPRYMGQLLNIQGNRKAEELNYTYFSDGRHMPLGIIVENGKLTEQSLSTLESAKGDMARHKFLVLQAEGVSKDVAVAGLNDDKSAVKIRMEPLAQMLQEDGLFQEYCKNNRDKIRSAFRLHPIYTGESHDYNRATADTARQITEEQVFSPEREQIAFKLNNLLKPALGITSVSMEFGAPTISDKAEIARALYPYISGGAASPNMLVDALGELLGKTFEPFEGEWADLPLTVALKQLEGQQKAEQAAQGQKDGAQPFTKADEATEMISTLKALQATLKEVLSGGQ